MDIERRAEPADLLDVQDVGHVLRCPWLLQSRRGAPRYTQRANNNCVSSWGRAF